jgi:hypothetical protein
MAGPALHAENGGNFQVCKILPRPGGAVDLVVVFRIRGRKPAYSAYRREADQVWKALHGAWTDVDDAIAAVPHLHSYAPVVYDPLIRYLSKTVATVSIPVGGGPDRRARVPGQPRRLHRHPQRRGRRQLMGHIEHEVIVVTTGDYRPSGLPDIDAFRESLPEELRRLVIGPIESAVNGYSNYVFLPDGSKLGWGTRERADEARERFKALFAQRYDDRSTCDDWVQVTFGANFERGAEITESHVDER